MNIYEGWSYRKILASRAAELKTRHPAWTQQRLAEKAGLQSSYLTHVLKERAHLNTDQLYAVASLLGCDDDESNYLATLLEWERSGLPARRNKLKAQIELAKKRQLDTANQLKKQVLNPSAEEESRFFLNPYYKLINAFLAVDRYARNPDRIAQALFLKKAQVDGWLKDLVQMGFVSKQNGQFIKQKRNFHLAKDSPFCLPHQTLQNQAVNRHLSSLPEDEKYEFQVTLSADPATRDHIQQEFNLFLKKVEALVKEAPSQEIYGLNFQLFRWSQDEEIMPASGNGEMN